MFISLQASEWYMEPNYILHFYVSQLHLFLVTLGGAWRPRRRSYQTSSRQSLCRWSCDGEQFAVRHCIWINTSSLLSKSVLTLACFSSRSL